jgi:tetrahydromethanopterin S-methyltransferase subunit B
LVKAALKLFLGSHRDIVRDDENGQIYLTASKMELKKDIEHYSNGIEIIKKLSPARFRWKNWRYRNEEVESIFLEKKHYGFIVEEVAEELPNFVAWDVESDSLAPQMWDLQSVISVSVAAIKELVEKVEALEDRIE